MIAGVDATDTLVGYAAEDVRRRGVDERGGVEKTEAEASVHPVAGAVLLPAGVVREWRVLAGPRHQVLHVAPRQQGAVSRHVGRYAGRDDTAVKRQ